jgi:cyclin B
MTWDWLVRVHWKFDLQQQTLFLTANYLDRYLSKVQVSRHKLQLVGVTAMFIACKYEEVVVPESADFVYMTDKAYSKAELIEMEREMLSQLNYRLAVSTQLDILKDLAQEAKASPYAVLLASYILELSLLTLDYLNYPPAQQAAAALFLSLRILNRDMSWNVKSFSASELRPLAKQFLCCYRDAGLNELRASFSKFAQPKQMSVSTIEII